MAAPSFEPHDAATAASMLAEASERRVPIRPKGSGTKLWWGGRSDDRAIFSTGQLRQPVQHYAGDLVATISSGTTLKEANAVLAGARQWLPLDPSHGDCATIGGIVATNDSGPRRHKHGAPRDLIIGVEIALCDGRVAKAGGRVVKNVAGYDLSRLLCGSFGSLAIVTSATFKLAPLPAASRTLIANCRDLRQAVRLALAVNAQPLTPSALEIAAPAAQLLIRFETTERAAEHMAAAARTLLEADGASVEILGDQPERDLWLEYDAAIWKQPGLVAKLSVLPTDVEHVLVLMTTVAGSVDWSLIGRAALGVLLVRVNEQGREASEALVRLEQLVAARGGTLITLRSDGARRFAGRASGNGLSAVMNAVKRQFDPWEILPPTPPTSPGPLASNP